MSKGLNMRKKYFDRFSWDLCALATRAWFPGTNGLRPPEGLVPVWLLPRLASKGAAEAGKRLSSLSVAKDGCGRSRQVTSPRPAVSWGCATWVNVHTPFSPASFGEEPFLSTSARPSLLEPGRQLAHDYRPEPGQARCQVCRPTQLGHFCGLLLTPTGPSQPLYLTVLLHQAGQPRGWGPKDGPHRAPVCCSTNQHRSGGHGTRETRRAFRGHQMDAETGSTGGADVLGENAGQRRTELGWWLPKGPQRSLRPAWGSSTLFCIGLDKTLQALQVTSQSAVKAQKWPQTTCLAFTHLQCSAGFSTLGTAGDPPWGSASAGLGRIQESAFLPRPQVMLPANLLAGTPLLVQASHECPCDDTTSPATPDAGRNPLGSSICPLELTAGHFPNKLGSSHFCILSTRPGPGEARTGAKMNSLSLARVSLGAASSRSTTETWWQPRTGAPLGQGPTEEPLLWGERPHCKAVEKGPQPDGMSKVTSGGHLPLLGSQADALVRTSVYSTGRAAVHWAARPDSQWLRVHLGVRQIQSSRSQARGPTHPTQESPFFVKSSRCPGAHPRGPRPGAPLTLLEALLFPRGLAERGRRDEDEPALGHVHGLQVLHHALQVRNVLLQGDVLLGVLVCLGGMWMLQPKGRIVMWMTGR
ncbi:hypothetical protein Cadr_000017748 [Camelus dromedarius]|uniref:Uncharacterized protein n=1 Tax=Camelus dromedarius TaxID=9838 RepID=A0A5N4D6J9_CAMDR|nr:hypothetical protein Cadr_000017748 [Camelus dromedarius]